MSKSILRRRGRRTKNTSFNPTSDLIKNATEEFLKNGGKVTRVVDVSEDYDNFLASRERMNPADEFLLGN